MTRGDASHAMVDVQGRCPACRRTGLFIATGGYITCSQDDCPNPTAVADWLEDPGPTPRLVVNIDLPAGTDLTRLLEKAA